MFTWYCRVWNIIQMNVSSAYAYKFTKSNSASKITPRARGSQWQGWGFEYARIVRMARRWCRCTNHILCLKLMRCSFWNWGWGHTRWIFMHSCCFRVRIRLHTSLCSNIRSYAALNIRVKQQRIHQSFLTHKRGRMKAIERIDWANPRLINCTMLD